jgi:hypothetical protein
MAFEELKNQSGRVQEETRAYIETTFAYYKLWGFKIAMKSATMTVKAVLVVLCITMVLLFGSVAAALAIGQALASNALGFLIVGGIYLLILLIIILLKDKIVEGPIIRKFSEIYFKE